jgi:GT2 family glycosyltransferase
MHGHRVGPKRKPPSYHPCVAAIAVLTVTFNSGRVLPDFLRSLTAQQGTAWHLYAVDNASADDTMALLRSFEHAQPARVTVLANAINVGAAAGNNQAIEAALADGFDLVLFLNNDVVFPPDLFQQLADGLAAHACDIACPRIAYADRPNTLWFAGGEFQAWAGYRTVHFGQSQPDSAAFDTPTQVTYAPTTCLLVTRRVLETIGLLDPAYFAYSEDADFMFRALRAHFRAWYIPQARLLHKVSSLAGHESPFSDRYGTRNRVYFLRRNIGGLRAVAWSGIYLAYCGLRWLAQRDSTARFRIKLAAWREGWKLPVLRKP